MDSLGEVARLAVQLTVHISLANLTGGATVAANVSISMRGKEKSRFTFFIGRKH